jgi:hypothetical protein
VNFLANQIKTVEFTVNNKGVTATGNITFWVMSSYEGTYDDTAVLSFEVTRGTSTIIVWTSGEYPPNSATIYVNDKPVNRNVGNQYIAVVESDKLIKISFEDLKDYTLKAFLDDVEVPLPVQFTPKYGVTHYIYASYGVVLPSAVQYFSGWVDLGINGWGFFANTSISESETQVKIPEYHMVKLKILMQPTEQGIAKIIVMKHCENFDEKYLEREFNMSSLATVEVDFKLEPGATGYYYKVLWNDVPIYNGGDVSGRPEVLLKSFFETYKSYIFLGGISIVSILAVIVFVIHYFKKRGAVS